MTDGITIGQAAAFAGVTVKTVRHYHRHGLIEEPRRALRCQATACAGGHEAEAGGW